MHFALMHGSLYKLLSECFMLFSLHLLHPSSFIVVQYTVKVAFSTHWVLPVAAKPSGVTAGWGTRHSLVELSVVRIIRHGHPHGYPCGYPCKWREVADIYTDVLALWQFSWISSWISVRMSVSNYPCNGLFDKGQTWRTGNLTYRCQAWCRLHLTMAVTAAWK